MFTITLCEVNTGTVLNANGEWHLKGTPTFMPKYETYDEAKKECAKLLQQYPHAEVWIEKEGSNEKGERIVSPKYNEYQAELLIYNKCAKIQIV